MVCNITLVVTMQSIRTISYSTSVAGERLFVSSGKHALHESCAKRRRSRSTYPSRHLTTHTARPALQHAREDIKPYFVTTPIFYVNAGAFAMLSR
jgi:hypothetical protein